MVDDHALDRHEVEIFSTGTHTDSAGVTHTFTADDLRQIAESYDPGYHEAPVVIGHPATDSPAYGWVKALQVVGDKLVATISMVSEFAAAVRAGLFRKRSASLYRDLGGRGMYLRHVGFLGGAPPAVKGLADLQLDDGGRALMLFNDNTEEEGTMAWKDWFKKAIDEMPDDGSGVPTNAGLAPMAATYSEDDIKAAVEKATKDAADKAKAEAVAEFAEREAATALAAKAEAHRAEAAARINAMAADSKGHVTPAMLRTGLVEFAQALPWAEELEFAEAGKATPYEWFCKFLDALPTAVDYSEFAGGAGQPVVGDAAAKLSAMVAAKRQDDKALSYSEAFETVQREHPELVAEYMNTFAA